MKFDQQAGLGSDAEIRRTQLLLGVVTIGAVCVLLLAGPGVWRAALAHDADPGALVAGLCLALAWVTACRIVLAGVALLVAAALDRAGTVGSPAAVAAREVSRRCTPVVLRGAVRLAVGATVAVGPLVGPTAFADTAPGPTASPSAVSSSQLPELDRLARVPVMAVAPLPGPTRDVTGAGPPGPARPPVSHVTVVAPEPTPRHSTPTVGAVVVQPGDSLWRIAARHLPAGYSEADVARAWPRWYAANRATIGPDPNVIQPGQVLLRPTA
jgi:LysM repeat protein